MKQKEKLINLFIRYLIILTAGLGNLYIFYKILTPLTTRAVALILNLFSPTVFSSNLILFKQITIQLIPACIAGSAYYLLLILILSTPNIKPKKTIKLITIAFGSLFILNTLRIVFLALINQTIYFESLHLLFWYGISTIFVLGIWLSTVKIYKIKDIPIYTDLKLLLKLSKPK